jgi:dihydrofolate reductase
MSIKVSVYVATSLDGFIARADGSIDWLNEANATVPEGEDLGFKEFMDSVDTLVMGRKTFEQVLSFGEWAYGVTPVVVLSHNEILLPAHLTDTVTTSSESPGSLLERLEGQGAKHIYLDGGNTIQGFLADGLIDQITITTIPIILGDGIPLFGSVAQDIKLRHLDTEVFDCGFVQTTYSLEKSD